MLLDLCYEEDSAATADFNVVMTGDGRFVEVQGTAEGEPYSRDTLDALLDLAERGIGQLLDIQRQVAARRTWEARVEKVMASAFLLALVAGLLGAAALLGLRLWATQRYADQTYNQVADTPPLPVAIVFGAGYWPSGRLSDALADRMETAIALYQAGKVNKLLLTGDNRFADYNEPAAMADYALARGVPREDLVLDYAGRRTYDSCYRAQAIFGVEQALLVTQAFHLPRALFTCNRLGHRGRRRRRRPAPLRPRAVVPLSRSTGPGPRLARRDRDQAAAGAGRADPGKLVTTLRAGALARQDRASSWQATPKDPSAGTPGVSRKRKRGSSSGLDPLCFR